MKLCLSRRAKQDLIDKFHKDFKRNIQWLYLIPPISSLSLSTYLRERLIIVFCSIFLECFLITLGGGFSLTSHRIRIAIEYISSLFDLKATFMKHSMWLQCSEEAFFALAGCVYIVFMTCIQNNDFASSHSRGERRLRNAATK